MDMSPRRSRQAPMSEMNVVPYIDVMLVLLVIFMITAPMLTQGVDVDLPSTEAEPLPVDTEKEPVIISVDSNGGYFLEVGDDRGKPKSLGTVVDEVASILAERPEADVFVRGDEHVRYGTVIRLMSSLQSAGAGQVGLITDPPEDE